MCVVVWCIVWFMHRYGLLLKLNPYILHWCIVNYHTDYSYTQCLFYLYQFEHGIYIFQLLNSTWRVICPSSSVSRVSSKVIVFVHWIVTEELLAERSVVQIISVELVCMLCRKYSPFTLWVHMVVETASDVKLPCVFVLVNARGEWVCPICCLMVESPSCGLLKCWQHQSMSHLLLP